MENILPFASLLILISTNDFIGGHFPYKALLIP